MGIGKYIKKAFLDHWNLLAVGAGAVFAVLSGHPDVVLPILAAGELAYLGLLSTHPKFQKALDAQEAKAKRRAGAISNEEALHRITRALPPASLRRYEALRSRASSLRGIARDLQRPTRDEGPLPFEDLQLKSLDRLLWIFLRLLYTEQSLGRFLEHTDERAISSDIHRLEGQFAQIPDDATNPRRQKARRTIQDNLETSKARLTNLHKAQENHELVQLEVDRLENKIRSLSELAVNRQEPDFISEQVDSVAHSMLETERTMDELRFATGLMETDEDVPELMNRPMLETEG